MIETRRLLLRRLSEEDADSIVLNMNDRDIVSNLEDVPSPFTEEDAKEWIMECNNDDSLVMFAITKKGEEGLIGEVGLNPIGRKEGEIVFWISKDEQGKGYASEAVAGFLDYVFKNYKIERVIGEVFVGNEGSAKLLKNVGFVYEGRKEDSEGREQEIYVRKRG